MFEFLPIFSTLFFHNTFFQGTIGYHISLKVNFFFYKTNLFSCQNRMLGWFVAHILSCNWRGMIFVLFLFSCVLVAILKITYLNTNIWMCIFIWQTSFDIHEVGCQTYKLETKINPREKNHYMPLKMKRQNQRPYRIAPLQRCLLMFA